MRSGNETEVLSGVARGGLRWVVVASGSDEDFYTMLNVYQDGRQVAGSGFGGPKLGPGSVINEWRGRKDHLPYFVMARTRPDVDRVVATTLSGTEITLALSPVVHGLRFAAAALPDGEEPGSLRAERAGVVLQARPQPMPEQG